MPSGCRDSLGRPSAPWRQKTRTLSAEKTEQKSALVNPNGLEYSLACSSFDQKFLTPISDFSADSVSLVVHADLLQWPRDV